MIEIKVCSDFSGIGCFDEALKRLGIEHETLFACDMDKYARQTYIANHGEPKYYPDNVYNREIPKEPADIYMTSPPCQAFSIAGKRKGESEERGVLFYNSHEFIKTNNPRYFIFENVKGLLSDDGGKTFNRWIDFLGGKSVNGSTVIFPHPESVPYHIYWKVLNATDYGVPQNRERVFIIGIRDDSDNTFSWPKEIPLEKKLRDCLDYEVYEKYYLSEETINALLNHSDKHKEKGNGFIFKPTEGDAVAVSITTKSGQRVTDNFIKVKSATKKGYETATPEDSINLSNPNSETRRGRVGVGVAQTLDTHCKQGVIQLNQSKESGGAQPYKQNRLYDSDGVSPVLDTECGRPNYLIKETNNIIQLNNPKHSNDRIYSDKGCSPTLNTMQGGNRQPFISDGYIIRRLTPREALRLMGFDDNFKIVVSDTQAYKQAGNGIVVDVLAAIISKLNLTK